MDDDDKTATASGSGDKFGQEVKEFRIKWCLNNIKSATQAKAIYAGILYALLKAHTDDIVILDHNLEEFVWLDKITDKEQKEILKKAKFPLHEATSRSEKKLGRWYGIHTVRSTVSLSTLKSHYLVMDTIKSAKAYANIHQFELTEWDITHLGFLRGYNNVHMNKNNAISRLTQEIESPNVQCPTFQLATTRVRLGKQSTQAYEVQCLRKDASKMHKLLTTGTLRTTMAFIPYSYKYKKTEAFTNAIRVHSKSLQDTWVVKIHGYTEEAINILKPALIGHKGATDIVPSFIGRARGEWKILVDKSGIDYYYHWLEARLPAFTQRLPTAVVISFPDDYPDCGINSRPPAAQQDDPDVDDDSYATMLSNAMSVATADYEKVEFDLPDELNKGKTDSQTEDANTPEQLSDITSARKSTPTAPPDTSNNNEYLEMSKKLQESVAETAKLRQELERMTTIIQSQQSQVAQQTTNTTKLELMVQSLLATFQTLNPPSFAPNHPPPTTPTQDTNIKMPNAKRKQISSTPRRLNYDAATSRTASPQRMNEDEATQSPGADLQAKNK
jgi:hypothetical protein